MELGKVTSRTLPFLIVVLAATISCRDKDPGPAPCRPHALLYDTDSIVYNYEDGHIKTVAYFISGRQTKQDEFNYSGNLLATVSKLTIQFDGTSTLDSQHSLGYNDQGQPVSLTTDSYAGHFVTEFTHVDKKLTKAETSSGYTQVYFIGSTRYEYDGNGNVPKVYYTINMNGGVKEVLARENLAFDEKDKFYLNSPELKIANEYVYGYLPGKNNCLSATVYYYSYAQHFTSPLSVTYTSAYNDQGLISSLKNEGTSTQLNSGEVLFNKVSYNCN
jgi:hypothetical protein